MTSMMQNMAHAASGILIAASFATATAPAHAGKKSAKSVPVAKAQTEKLAPEDACEAEYVVAKDGTVLHQKQATSELPLLPASTSKLMPDLLYADAIRAKKIRLDDPLSFVPHVGYDICSLSDIKKADKPVTGTVHNALMMFNVKSSNSAGFALQAYLEQRTGQPYAKLAAAKAQELGLTHSVFAEATGMSNSRTCSGQKTGPRETVKWIISKLHELGGFKPAIAATGSTKVPVQNMISPTDLSILTRTALADELVAPYLEARSYTFAGKTYDKSDEFLRTNPAVDGKSGWAYPAGGSITYKDNPSGATVSLMHCMPTGKIYNARHERAKQIEALIPQWQNAARSTPVSQAVAVMEEEVIPTPAAPAASATTPEF